MKLCADHSRHVGERLIGTASRVDTWFLLEYAAAWGANALSESYLPDVVKTHLQKGLETIPHARVLFIRQPQRRVGFISFFVVESLSRQIKAFALQHYDELLSFDMQVQEGLAAIEPPQALYLVCTNGRRDAACSSYGVPVYEQLSAYEGDLVWQSTHLGGHRFAATAAFLPEGQIYGHLDSPAVPGLIAHHQAGDIMLSHYRGRSSYEPPVQAAEHFLLQAGHRELQLVELRNQHDHMWDVVFQSNQSRYPVRVERRLSAYEIYKSTGDDIPVQVPVWVVSPIEADVS